jgi:acyl-CoA thioester hydrolase
MHPDTGVRKNMAYHFHHPIEVRYGDLDPQGHLNNAKYLTYMEQARIAYLQYLGLWEGGSFFEIGMILAEVCVTYKSPIHWGQVIRVGVRVSRLGNKSFDIQYTLEDSETGVEHASGSTVQVTYDYHTGKTIPIPARWRETISAFENIPPASP